MTPHDTTQFPTKGSHLMDDDFTARGALDELIDAYESLAPRGPSAGPVIGVVGQDVPIELIEASGARPLRLRGNPGWDRAAAEHYLGTGLDPATTSIFAGILAGRFGALDAIAVSSDCDASQRLFYALREMRRVEPEAGIPPAHLVDMLHLPRESTARYNLVRLEEFVTQLRAWTGAPLDDASIRAAIVANNRVRQLQRHSMQLRHEKPSRLTGVESLALLGARTRMDREDYAALLERLLEVAGELPTHGGVRVFLTGSSHDSTDVYSLLEGAGAIVVGEDHDWGELPTERDLADESLRGIAVHYRDNGPTPQRAMIASRAAHTAAAAAAAGAEVVLAYSRLKDEAPLWDVPLQRATSPVRFETVLRQPYGQVNPDAVAALLAATDRQENAS
ncbi:MAG TPA: 2-hydroxyacyl-CoA dehydratase family protein [Terrimesophilobacter sp.]|nr:2-hydroxyacyl-CoA dehydratase family protein [Terrimesophilobacter sp.]